MIYLIPPQKLHIIWPTYIFSWSVLKKVGFWRCGADFVITGDRGVLNLNNSDEPEFIRKWRVPFLINQIEMMNIRIRLLINRIRVCSIRVIPIRNRMHSMNIPYEPNNTRIFQRVKQDLSRKCSDWKDFGLWKKILIPSPSQIDRVKSGV